MGPTEYESLANDKKSEIVLSISKAFDRQPVPRKWYNKKMQTLRKRIAGTLEKESLDVREISQRFGLKEKDVVDHLKHIARSVHGKRFVMEPASCGECGFSFRKRERLNTPSRCPICKNEQILSPRFQILPTSLTNGDQNSKR